MTPRVFQVIFLCLVSVFLYANILWNGFVWDDNIFITHNPSFQDFKNIPSFFSEGFCAEVEKPCDFYRPVVSLTYLLDYVLWGLQPFGFHLTNLIIHTLVVLLVYWVAVKLEEALNPLAPPPEFISWMPFSAALFFAIHPVHVESVAPVFARTDSPTALFMLGSLLFFIEYRKSEGSKKWVFYGVSFVMFVVALFTKEMAVTLPFLLIVFDLLLTKSPKRFSATKALSFVPFFIVLTFYFRLRASALGKGLNPEWENLPDRLYHIPAMLMRFVKLMVFPFPLKLYHSDPSVWDNPFWDGIFSVTLLFLILILMVGFFRVRPFWGFSLFWFCFTIVPVSNLIPIGYTTVTERFAYIPSIGFCWFLGGLASEILILKKSDWVKRFSHVLVGFFFLLLVICGVIVFERNKDWKSDTILWAKEVQHSPASYIAQFNYATVLNNSGNFQEAAFHFQRSISLQSDFVPSYMKLANIYESTGKLDEAIQWYQKVFLYDPKSIKAHFNLGKIYLDEGKLELGKTEFENIINWDPKFSQAHHYLGVIFSKSGEIDAAFNAFQTAIQTNPANAEAHRALGFLYVEQMNKPGKGIFHFQRAQELLPVPDPILEEVLTKIKKDK